MTIVGVAAAFPQNHYSQTAITEALKHHWGARLTRPAMLDRIHAHSGVRQRHLAFPFEQYAKFTGWGEANRAWLKVATELGEHALGSALRRAGIEPTDLDALYVVTVTGVASPSLDARLINRIGLRSDLKRTPIFGLGCVGGAVGLTRAADYVRAFPEEVAAVLAVEICSLTIQADDLSDLNLLATGLFSDGAGAAIVAGPARRADGPTIVDTRSVFYPETEQLAGWEISDRGFRVILSRELPEVTRRRLAASIDDFLAHHHLTRAAIESWVIHPGGPKIMEAFEQALDLKGGELAAAWHCLAEAGNISSASVLHVLEEVMTHRRPAPRTHGLIIAMGPGFCAELILVRW
jgi:alkylresorcinol/alkylpyrone synthase